MPFASRARCARWLACSADPLTALSNTPSTLCLLRCTGLCICLCVRSSGLFADLVLLIELCALGLGLLRQVAEELQEAGADAVLLVKGDGSVDDRLGENVAVCEVLGDNGSSAQANTRVYERGECMSRRGKWTGERSVASERRW